MKTYFNLILLAGAITLLFPSCKKDEAPEASTPEVFYQLPQGDQPHDATFVKFQQEYGTYFLYRFSDNDFRWNGTTRLLYMAKNGEEVYIPAAYSFINRAFLSDYAPEKLQELLPYKILLSGGIHQLTVNASKPTGYDTLSTNVGLYSGINQVTFGYANPAISTLTAVQKLDLQANLHKAFFSYALGREKVKAPDAFSALFNVTGNSATAYKGLGFLEFQRSYTVNMDFAFYIYAALRYNETQFRSLYLGTAFDSSGLVAKKYAIVKQYLASVWNINTETIANRAL